jgi:hypothetical protein
MSMQAFYDELAPLYHLVYENWEASAPGRGAVIIYAKSGVGGDGDMTFRLRSCLQTALTNAPPS